MSGLMTTTNSNALSTRAAGKSDPATAAMVAQAQADIQARFIIADSRPRDWEKVRARSLATSMVPSGW